MGVGGGTAGEQNVPNLGGSGRGLDNFGFSALTIFVRYSLLYTCTSMMPDGFFDRLSENPYKDTYL